MTSKTKKILFNLQHYTAGLVFLTGVALHVTALAIGREKFLALVLTPLFDSIFAIPMTFSGIAGILLWKSIDLEKRWKKIIYGVGIFYLMASVPLHVQTIISQDTTYINKFSETYSYFIIPVMLFLAWFFITQPELKKQS